MLFWIDLIFFIHCNHLLKIANLLHMYLIVMCNLLNMTTHTMKLNSLSVNNLHQMLNFLLKCVFWHNLCLDHIVHVLIYARYLLSTKLCKLKWNVSHICAQFSLAFTRFLFEQKFISLFLINWLITCFLKQHLDEQMHLNKLWKKIDMTNVYNLNSLLLSTTLSHFSHMITRLINLIKSESFSLNMWISCTAF